MGKTETGEFELVLGNRQLLSGLAIVAILFGVFFAMGYIVGRNSTPAPRLGASTETPTTAEPLRAQPRGTSLPQQATPTGETPSATTPAAGTPDKPPEDATPQPTTQPAREPAAPAKPVETPSASAAPPEPSEPEPGQPYLQVMAVKRSEAEVVIKTLQDKGFQATMAPSPKDGIFRVLVGPFRDNATIGKTKADLENLGFHPFVQK